MTALAGSEEKYAAMPYSDVVKGLNEVTQRASTRTRRQDERFGKWGTQVTNCTPTEGNHWVLTSVKYSDPPQAILWEPWKDNRYSKKLLVALQEVCGKKNVKVYYTAQQSDGWSCGYISAWWKLLMVSHGANFDDGRPIRGVPEQPPVGWAQLVWLMLELRDQGLKNTRASALNVGLYPYYTEAMNDHTVDFVGKTRAYLLKQLIQK